MTELRAIDSGSPMRSVARAAYEYTATWSSLVVFGLLCLGWSMLAVPLAPNHPSLIDAVLIAGRHPNLSCIMKSELMGNILLGPGARLACYIRNGSPRQMVREALADLREGGTLLLFPEGTRTLRSPINPLSKSVGVIAKHADVAVQSLLIETDSNYLGKGCSPWARTSLPIAYRIRLGRRFEPPADASAFSRELEHYLRSELQQDTCR